MKESGRACKGCFTAVGACHWTRVTDRTLKALPNQRPYYRLTRLNSRLLGLAGGNRTTATPALPAAPRVPNVSKGSEAVISAIPERADRQHTHENQKLRLEVDATSSRSVTAAFSDGFFGSYFERLVTWMLPHSTASGVSCAMMYIYIRVGRNRSSREDQIALSSIAAKSGASGACGSTGRCRSPPSFLTSHLISSTELVLLRAEPTAPSP